MRRPELSWLVGFGLGGLPGVVAAAAVSLVNPGFVDAPASAWFWLCALPGLASARWFRQVRNPEWAAVAAVLPLLGMLGLGYRALPAPIAELRLLVVGVDGASWQTVDRFKLPALRRERARGVAGVMQAEPPLFSPVLWTTLFTGRTQSEHGVRGFQVHATDLKVPTVFDIAEHAGHRLGLMGWLVGWPPRKMPRGGFLVPGWLAPSPETEPARLGFLKEIELSHRLHRQHRPASPLPWLAARGAVAGLRFSTLRDAIWSVGPGRWGDLEVERQLLRARMQRDVFVAELGNTRPSVALYVYYPTDALGHRYWDRTGPASPVARAYHDADAMVHELRGLLPPEGRLAVLSDHGFRAIDAAGDGVLVSPRTAPIAALVARATGDGRGGTPQVGRVGAKLVIAVGDRVDAARRAVAALTLRGVPLFRVSVAPDDPNSLVLDLTSNHVRADDWGVRVGDQPLSAWVEPNTAFTGDHDPEGLFLAVGDGIPVGRGDVRAVDVAPTLLGMIGLHRGTLPGTPPAGMPDLGAGPSWDFVRGELEFPSATSDDVNQELLESLGYVESRDK
jgi:hypothetical protein